MRGKSRDAVAASALVHDVLRRYGLGQAVREHRLVTSWDEIVGARIATRSWPDGLKHGVLHVRVANSAWLHELSFLREAMMGRANELLGPPLLVKEVRLHLGAHNADADDVVAALARVRPNRQAPRPRAKPSDAALKRIDDEAGSVGDEELRAIIRDARRKIGF
jgi:predicted nucleic acid-binding Zn ribbon protein